MTKKIERVDSAGGNEFRILVDGVPMFYVERDRLSDGRRGHWALKMFVNGIGTMIVDRDQYSNDLFERVSIHENERPVYGDRFRFDCTREQFDTEILKWLDEFQQVLGGDWRADFELFRPGEVVIERQ
jgi:hypothetical protein